MKAITSACAALALVMLSCCAAWSTGRAASRIAASQPNARPSTEPSLATTSQTLSVLRRVTPESSPQIFGINC